MMVDAATQTVDDDLVQPVPRDHNYSLNQLPRWPTRDHDSCYIPEEESDDDHDFEVEDSLTSKIAVML
jgi:hypothetical protein